MNTIRLYKVNHYATYMASEQGERWSLEKPSKDTIHYKQEVVEEALFLLPDGFEVKEYMGDKRICKGGEEYTLITESDGSVELVGSEIVILKKVDCR